VTPRRVSERFPAATFAIGELVLWTGSCSLKDWRNEGVPLLATITDNDDTKNGVRVYGLDNGRWAYEDQLTATAREGWA
jgi:hypothetical protein